MPSWRDTVTAKLSADRLKIPESWRLPEDIRQAARQQRAISGAYIESLLSDDTIFITNSTNDQLLRQMANGSLSALSVVSAFCKRAAYAHQLSNCLLEINFEAAQQRAEELDAFYTEKGRLIGPLHGLVYSMKDQWHMKKLDTSMAYVGWIGTQGGRHRANDDDDLESELVTTLHSLGAIPIAKTSLMQTIWDGETNNNILGYQWNPSNHNLSAGGSSGGEGAFQSLRGSTFGFGTDIGGSVSMPAACNGVFSLKPSHGRISMKNTANSSPGQMLIPTVAGIYAHTVSDLRLIFEALLSSKPWLRDPEVLPIPYRTPQFDGETLAFGLLASDQLVRPHPPISRAVRIVARALSHEGHQLLEWQAPNHEEGNRLHEAITDADRRADILERVGLCGEPTMPSLGGTEGSLLPPATVHDFYKSAMELQEFRANYAAYWNSTETLTSTGRPVDALIMPVMPHAAPRPGMIYYYGFSCSVNVLDYCSVVIPVSKVDSTLDKFDPDYVPLGQVDADTWRAYDPEIYHGAPTAVQIVCRRLEEEKLLSIAQVVVEALNHTSES